MSLKLAEVITKKTVELCVGLERGSAPILSMVTETTAELLTWWFSEEYSALRTYNFHEGQKQAILNVIYAHEVAGISSLKDLYSHFYPLWLCEGYNIEKTLKAKNSYPKYCLKMATGTGKTWVLQALLIWQFLNSARNSLDERFTRNFLIVAPGLIVYDRLIDAFNGKERDGKRDFVNSDIFRYQELFLPEYFREEVFQFIRFNTRIKEEMGSEIGTSGLIAITNWHALKEEEEDWASEDRTRGEDIDYKELAEDLLPYSEGNKNLEELDRRNSQILKCLKALPDLLVFNDEAHHIHETAVNGEIVEVEWQKSLNLLAEAKGRRFTQIDFSATPYKQRGGNKIYFDHIIMDFDLREALNKGLVKALTIDKRKELGALPLEDLDFKVKRDELGNPLELSEGQKSMLRAGLTRLHILEDGFEGLDPSRKPKMMVLCEDTKVSPFIEQFFISEGLSKEDVLLVDTNRKGDVPKAEWEIIREKLFDIDNHVAPKIIISVLMLREGFDVNNICVIVPLRATDAPILLEQTVGRGLRLMWREDEFTESKNETRNLLKSKKEPKNFLDLLFIIEHPRFAKYYDDLQGEGHLINQMPEPTEPVPPAGDWITLNLKPGYEEHDFAIPMILRGRDEETVLKNIDANILPIFRVPVDDLRKFRGKGDVFVGTDAVTGKKFGEYTVLGGMMDTAGYNEYISKLVNMILCGKEKLPCFQFDKSILAEVIDQYIRKRLFGTIFDPLVDENWRLLLLDPIVKHISEVLIRNIFETERELNICEAEIQYQWLSQVSSIKVRESVSLKVNKCIYERLPYDTRDDGFEAEFIKMCDNDSYVERFCKLIPKKHKQIDIRYFQGDSFAFSHHYPDFIVKLNDSIFLVETKGQNFVGHSEVQLKKKASVNWCDRINQLEPDKRSNVAWYYALLGRERFKELAEKGASVKEILNLVIIADTRLQLSVS